MSASKGSGEPLENTSELHAGIESGHAEDKQIGIKFMDGSFHRRGISLWIARHSRVDDHRITVVLEQGQEYDGLRSIDQAAVLTIASHADHREPLAVGVNPLANRLLARPVSVAEFLIDDGNRLRLGAILPGKVTPRDERNPHGPKVIRTYVGTIDFHRFAGLGKVTIGLDNARMECEAERREIRHGRGVNPGESFKLREHLAVERNALIFRISGGPELIGSQQNMVGVEAGILALGVPQTAGE